MFKFVKGSSIKKCDKLKEGYSIEDNAIRANVSVDKILKVMKDFVKMQDKDSRLFLFIEVPCNLKDEKIKKEATETETGIIGETTHKDVYYLDGIPQQVTNKILESASDILINDGLVSFGIGNHFTDDKIGKYSYNEMYLYFKNDIKDYEKLFTRNEINKDNNLVSPWDLITEDNPGVSKKYVNDDGMDIYDLIKTFENSFEEFYKAEKRLEN